jgi:hypothetical protein
MTTLTAWKVSIKGEAMERQLVNQNALEVMTNGSAQEPPMDRPKKRIDPSVLAQQDFQTNNRRVKTRELEQKAQAHRNAFNSWQASKYSEASTKLTERGELERRKGANMIQECLDGSTLSIVVERLTADFQVRRLNQSAAISIAMAAQESAQKYCLNYTNEVLKWELDGYRRILQEVAEQLGCKINPSFSIPEEPPPQTNIKLPINISRFEWVRGSFYGAALGAGLSTMLPFFFSDIAYPVLLIIGAVQGAKIVSTYKLQFINSQLQSSCAEIIRRNQRRAIRLLVQCHDQFRQQARLLLKQAVDEKAAIRNQKLKEINEEISQIAREQKEADTFLRNLSSV